MIATFGNELEIRRSISWREASDTLVSEYHVGGTSYPWEELPRDVRELLQAVSVSYIHPQEGAALLAKAQEKFKERLFHNWGRHASVAEQVKNIEAEWARLRATANSYLSSALSTRLREIWPNAEVKVDLPENIRDIVAVSDITFRTSPSLPQISLTSHGTGAQSAILYQTHYVLDSDRTLHQGQYYPVWLLEEPESFLHADIAFQIARLLSSDEWLGSIQMVTSTHSPIILAGSRRNADLASWVVCDDGAIRSTHDVPAIDEDVLATVASLMGDGNFGVYFRAAQADCQVFLEDSRTATAEKFTQAGIPNVISLKGIADVDRHLHVLVPLQGAVGTCYFVVDADDGLKTIKGWLDRGVEVASKNGWRKIDCGGDCFVLILPEGHAVEHLFDVWPGVLQTAVEDLYDLSTKKLRDASPMDLTRAAGTLRNRAPNDPKEGARLLAGQQDVKDRFWNQVNGATIGELHLESIRVLIGLPESSGEVARPPTQEATAPGEVGSLALGDDPDGGHA